MRAMLRAAAMVAAAAAVAVGADVSAAGAQAAGEAALLGSDPTAFEKKPRRYGRMYPSRHPPHSQNVVGHFAHKSGCGPRETARRLRQMVRKAGFAS